VFRFDILKRGVYFERCGGGGSASLSFGIFKTLQIYPIWHLENNKFYEYSKFGIWKTANFTNIKNIRNLREVWPTPKKTLNRKGVKGYSKKNFVWAVASVHSKKTRKIKGVRHTTRCVVNQRVALDM